MSKRRSGWVVLFAAVAAVLGAAFAVRAKKRKQTAPPEPRPRLAVVPPRTAAGSDAERWLVRMAIGAAVFLVLAIDALVLATPRDDGMTIPQSMTTASVGDGARALGWTLNGNQRVELVTDDGARVQVGIERAGDAVGSPSVRYFVYTAHFQNTGTVAARVEMIRAETSVEAAGSSHPADRSAAGGDQVLEPGWGTSQQVTFKLPQYVDPTRLHLAFRLNDSRYRADWNL